MSLRKTSSVYHDLPAERREFWSLSLFWEGRKKEQWEVGWMVGHFPGSSLLPELSHSYHLAQIRQKGMLMLDPLPIKTSGQDLVLINNFFRQTCHFKILLLAIHIWVSSWIFMRFHWYVCLFVSHTTLRWHWELPNISMSPSDISTTLHFQRVPGYSYLFSGSCIYCSTRFYAQDYTNGLFYLSLKPNSTYKFVLEIINTFSLVHII